MLHNNLRRYLSAIHAAVPRADTGMSTHGLVAVDLEAEEAPTWREVVSAATGSCDRLHVFFKGGCAEGSPGPATLALLAQCYDSIVETGPQVDLVPLLPSAGWTAEKVAAISGVSFMFRTEPSKDSESALLKKIAALRTEADGGLPPLTDVGVATEQARAHIGAGESDAGAAGRSYEYEHVSVGGTFDRMHAGHRLLLAAAAVVTKGRLYVGISGDDLLVNKKHKELLQSYADRERAVLKFLAAVKPGLDVEIGPLDNSPPKAATIEPMEALVISHETVAGAKVLNDMRAERGFAPIEFVTVDLVGAETQDASAPKLSSTTLRQKEAAGQANM